MNYLHLFVQAGFVTIMTIHVFEVIRDFFNKNARELAMATNDVKLKDVLLTSGRVNGLIACVIFAGLVLAFMSWAFPITTL